MPDFDEKTGMDVIKESMNMTDEDFSPQGGELDWGDGNENESSGDEGEQQEPQGRQDSFESHEPVDYGRTQQPEQRQQQPDPLKQNTLKFDPRTDFRQDKKGNLVDAKTGEIIAKAGSEARIYQRVHKQATDYIKAATGNIQNQMQQERGKLNRAVEIGLGFEKELSDLRATFKQINAYELPKEGLLEAAAYYKQAQSDPVGVLKNLLTRAALGGIDISQLGMDNKGIDPKTLVEQIRKEIQAGIAPVQQFTSQQQKVQQERQVEAKYQQQAETQVQQFFGGTPEAIPYTHVFHAVLSQPRFQHMSLGEIWDKVQLHLIRNGIDPRQAPSRNQRQRMNGTTNGSRPSVSLPNGQGMAPSGGNGNGRGPAGPAHPSLSYDAIIREVLGNSAQR
jgi:hypothetical protein